MVRSSAFVRSWIGPGCGMPSIASANARSDFVPDGSAPTFPSTCNCSFGELPFITGLYERARQELDDDENLSIDGIKELLITARTAYQRISKNRSRTITPHTLSTILKYVRNLTLLERRMTPDLFNLVIAAKQVAGDAFALHVASRNTPGSIRIFGTAFQS